MRNLRTTHTYAVLQISRAAYDEIRGKLLEADYGHALHREEGFELIDMRGIALQSLEVPAAGVADQSVPAFKDKG